MTKLNQFKEAAEQFIDKHNLNAGNAEVWEENGELLVTVEAPNNWTVCLDFRGEMPNDAEVQRKGYEGLLKEKLSKVVDDLDVEDYFNELWSEEFGRHNGFTAKGFMEMLEVDYAFYQEFR